VIERLAPAGFEISPAITRRMMGPLSDPDVWTVATAAIAVATAAIAARLHGPAGDDD
jgi:hypothetical protein